MARFFVLPVGLSLVALGIVFAFGGIAAFLTAALLSVLEVTLSFDNAVVNARVLKKMTPHWQKRFLTWGMLVAVLGTRLLFPVLIVSATVWLSPFIVLKLALFDGPLYGALIAHAHFAINAFGGVFLLLVSLNYFLDDGKKVHWIRTIEKQLSAWGEIRALEIALALAVLFGVSLFVPAGPIHEMVLLSGVIGILLFVLMQFVVSAFSLEEKSGVLNGLALFLYLNILDSAFSLDSVVGAFALTTAIPIIVVGLGIGAYFVRALTLYLVRHRTLDSLLYIEHGAHWAIFGLAASMFANLLTSVPEFLTGSVGLLFVLAAYYSSLHFNHTKH